MRDTSLDQTSSGLPPSDVSESEDESGDQLELFVTTSTGVTVVKLVPGTEYLVGRGEGCAISIPDSSVSRVHARVVVGDRIVIEDLGSSNGTRVRGSRIGRDPVQLEIGEVVQIGSAMLVIQHRTGACITTAPPPPLAESVGISLPPPPSTPTFGAVVRDPEMQRLYGMLNAIAPSPLNVLILGETGVGKEVFAEQIHIRSHVSKGHLLRINCAALPTSTLEAELFGYEKGAFTGAVQAKPGLFEAAQGGTVLLDEVGELPLQTQVKLLRFLESGEVLRLGSLRPKSVTVRIISATNRNLRKAVSDGLFRSDLYFRLDGITVTLPPLRRRPRDVLPLAQMFIERFAMRLGRYTPALSRDAISALETHSWPGNVRELKNVVERAVVLCSGSEIEVDHLGLEPMELADSIEPTRRFTAVPETDDFPPEESVPESLTPEPDQLSITSRLPVSLHEQLRAVEREQVLDALNRASGNQSQAAKLLGISRSTLIARLRGYGVSRPRKR